MKKSNKYSPKVRERSVRLVQEILPQHESLWAAVESIAPKIGCVPSTLLDWVKREQIGNAPRIEACSLMNAKNSSVCNGRSRNCGVPTRY